MFKCTKLGKVFNADLIAAYNIFNDSDVEQYLDDTSNPRVLKRGGGNGRRPGQGLNL